MIRKGKIEDLPELLDLIIELAVYEKAENEVSNTIERMKEDGFGNNPVYGFLVAEEGGKVVGASIYYYRYSTWKGKRIYLEDLIVNENWRGKGIGRKLFEQTIAIGKESNCTGMMWQVLDWNKSAINFYKKYHTEFDEEWINCHLQF